MTHMPAIPQDPGPADGGVPGVVLGEFVTRASIAFQESGRAVQAMVEQIAAAFRPLVDFLREHPELVEMVREPELPACHHACWMFAAHECQNEATTTEHIVSRSFPGGRDVQVCQSCMDATTAERFVRTLKEGKR